MMIFRQFFAVSCVPNMRCMRVKSPLHRVNVDMDCCPIERVKLGVPPSAQLNCKVPCTEMAPSTQRTGTAAAPEYKNGTDDDVA